MTKTTTEWITAEDAMEMLDIGRGRLDQLRASGTVKMKRTSGKGRRTMYTHCKGSDVLAYSDRLASNKRLTASSKLGKSRRGVPRTKRVEPVVFEKSDVVEKTGQLDAPKLSKFGDGYRLPRGRKAYMLTARGIKSIDSSKIIVI